MIGEADLVQPIRDFNDFSYCEIRLGCIWCLLGAHSGDMAGFFFGKTLCPSLLRSDFFVKRQNMIEKAQSFLAKTGSYTVILGRFVPAIRPIVPFLLGISDLKATRFYFADIIACICWGIALGFLVTGVGSILR